MKKLIIALVLLGLVLPGVVGAAIPERPTADTCTLKHDLTSIFGAGFEKGEAITSRPSVATGLANIKAVKEELKTKYEAEPKKMKTVVYTEAQMKTKRNNNNTLNWICNIVWGITFRGTDCTDEGLTAGELMTILDMIGPIIDKIGDIPLIGEALNELLTGLITASIGVEIATHHEDAPLACMVDKIETAEDWFFVVFMVVAGILVMYGAFVFLTAAGSPEKLTLGRNILIWAAVGLIVAFISKGIVKIIIQMMV